MSIYYDQVRFKLEMQKYAKSSQCKHHRNKLVKVQTYNYLNVRGKSI